MTRKRLHGQLTCRCCGEGAVSLKMMLGLGELLDRLPEDYEIIITSGYRCKKNNEACGGSPTSKHMEGIAVDIVCKDLDVIGLFGVVKEVEIFDNGGIGVYLGRKEWLHIDLGRRRRWGYKDGNIFTAEEYAQIFDFDQ